MRYDLAVLLGSQIFPDGLAPHTELKAKSAVIAAQEEIAEKFIISGGYNFFVRYNKKEILESPDFSFEAFVKGRSCPSEGQKIKSFMIERGVEKEKIFIEDLSAYTKENAEIVSILLQRTTFEFVEKMALITLAYHMVRAYKIFKETFEKRGLNIELEPLFSEDLLALRKGGVETVCDYYGEPKGGRTWPTEKIRKLLLQGKTMGNLVEI